METLIPPPSAQAPHATQPKAEFHFPDPAAVQRVLDEVLSSPPFCHTQQCQNLLRYIVKHTLAGEEHLLRERVIGAEVFGRRPDYETGDDPVVRIRAAEVRKRLAQYYQSLSESAHPPEVQIDIPSGSYRAAFRWREGVKVSPEVQHAMGIGSGAADLAEPVLVMPPVQDTGIQTLPSVSLQRIAPELRKVRITRLWWAAAMVLLLAGALIYGLTAATQNVGYRQFWQPWTSGAKPVIISIGSNAVYRLSDDVTDDYARKQNLETHGMEFFVPTGPGTPIKGTDVMPAEDSFVALGDVAAVSTIVATVTRQKQTFQERFPNDISFAELRDNPTVLVGGFNNPMTVELTKDLPFVLRTRNEIDDTQTPGRRWVLHASTDSHNTEDYAIITRLAQRGGDAPILSVAGMGQYGTLAAANFICSPASVAQLTRQLPAGWVNRDLQLVLHVRVVDFKAASSDIVALRTW
jgi:hypothetical protein